MESLPEAQRAAFLQVIAEAPGQVAMWEAALDPDFSLVGWEAARSVQAAWDAFGVTFNLPDPGGGRAPASSPAQFVPAFVSESGRLFGHEGGIVPGPRGSEVPVTLLGGEEVLPISQAGRGGGGVTIIQNIAGSILAEDEVLEIARQGLVDAAIDGGSLEF
ncbi:hypothetical protein LCGC14_2943110, partial [marine sediment metagenome]